MGNGSQALFQRPKSPGTLKTSMTPTLRSSRPLLLACALLLDPIANGQIYGRSTLYPAPPAESVKRPTTVSVKEAEEHLVTKINVSYPPIAAAAHVSGTVVVGAEINAAGNVTQTVILSGPEMLRAAALEGVKQYKYRSFTIDGSAATVRTAVQVRFLPFHSRSS